MPFDFKIGVEHEQFVFKKDNNTLRRVSYSEPHGIQTLLEFFEREYGFLPIVEQGWCIGLIDPKTKDNISLEPGGQFELSSAPRETLDEVKNDLVIHLKRLKEAEERLNFTFIPQGFDDISPNGHLPWMPKQRYDIMRRYMSKVGDLGHYMMQRTCTMQINLDFSSEQDMVKKMRVAMCLQPIIAGVFTNSAYGNSKAFRTYIWQHTDQDRSGILKCVFDKAFGFEAYVDYVLSVPMYFIKRDGIYHDVAGACFKDFINGSLTGFEGTLATLQDFEDHTTVMFPEVRLKKFLELRGADAGNLDHMMALVSFWVNLLYKPQHLDNVFDIISTWCYEDVQQAYLDVARHGNKATLFRKTMQEWFSYFCDFFDKNSVMPVLPSLENS